MNITCQINLVTRPIGIRYASLSLCSTVTKVLMRAIGVAVTILNFVRMFFHRLSDIIYYLLYTNADVKDSTS